MSHLVRPTFLAGVLVCTAFFLIGPSPVQNISPAQAQQCLPRGQLCPAGYTSVPIPPGTYSPNPNCDHVCVPPGYTGGPGAPGQNVPLCQQYPNNPACR